MRIFLNYIQKSIGLLSILLLVFGFSSGSLYAQTQTFSNPGSHTYTVPEYGVNTLKVQLWGGGGGGGTRNNNGVGGGGGGGAYTYAEIPVKPGEIYNIVVGAGGSGNSNNGANSEIQNANEQIIIYANGGKGVPVNTQNGSEGGEAIVFDYDTDIFDVKNVYSEKGAAGDDGTFESGWQNRYGGDGGNGAYPLNVNEGKGGKGKDNSSNGAGESGGFPGGGGGGARRNLGVLTHQGGAGAHGRIIIEESLVEYDYSSLPEADLYTEVSYTIDNGTGNAQLNPSDANFGDIFTFTVKVGNNGPDDILQSYPATFTFTLPFDNHPDSDPNVDQNNINLVTVSTALGSSYQVGPMNYIKQARTYKSEVALPAGQYIEYTFTGRINQHGYKHVEATVLRPNGVFDPDATNAYGVEPYNAQYECYNAYDPSTSGLLGLNPNKSCNNISFVNFLVLSECVDEILYYEDFDTDLNPPTTFAKNNGRRAWTDTGGGIPSVAFNNSIPSRTGPKGNNASYYSFAPGKDDPLYTEQSPHSPKASISRIKSGYYAVAPLGYIKQGIPDSDDWSGDNWNSDPNVSHDADDPNSNYDWTKSWENEDAQRDMSGKVNGNAFHVRGIRSGTQSVQPFYRFEIEEPLSTDKTYTLSLYSFVTYHTRDYLMIDVIDADTGFIYASVPLVYPDLASGNFPYDYGDPFPSGAHFGWIRLEATFHLEGDQCDLVGEDVGNVRFAIRGAKDYSAHEYSGFGHTMIDNIMLYSNTDTCDIPEESIHGFICGQACFNTDGVTGSFFHWDYLLENNGVNVPNHGHVANGTAIPPITFTQPPSSGGFTLDIHRLDNSFNMIINDEPFFSQEIQFEAISGSTYKQNIRFKSDKKLWGVGGNNPTAQIYNLNLDDYVTIDPDNVDYENLPTPALRINFDFNGNVTLLGKRQNNAPLEELELFDNTNTNNETNALNNPILTTWHTVDDNVIQVTQIVQGRTGMTGTGYGQNIKEEGCETCTVVKSATFNDENKDGYAQAGETISYTLEIANLGDMEIYDITIDEPLIGQIAINAAMFNREDIEIVSFNGATSHDPNEDYVLNLNDTWTLVLKYTITNDDVFVKKGIYNQANLVGTGQVLTTHFNINESSTDTMELKDREELEGWTTDALINPYGEDATYTPLMGVMNATNPMLLHPSRPKTDHKDGKKRGDD